MRRLRGRLGVVMLMSDKVKSVIGNKQGQFLMIKGLIHQEGIKTFNLCNAVHDLNGRFLIYLSG